MSDKLFEYQGCAGWWHEVRDNCSEKLVEWKAQHVDDVKDLFKTNQNCRTDLEDEEQPEDYSHLNRHKTRKELVRISAAVMGIEFSYAAETAFVSPTLLKIGVEHKHMTLVWALSPLIGFFLTPLLGSLSDRCHLNIGRRRPFIFIMSLGVLLGLILVPNGETLGYLMGDPRPPSQDFILFDNATQEVKSYNNSHPWGVFFTILGTVLLDFDADGCQSPARAYLLDVTIPEDHAKGLSTFTIMAGLGGFLGYALGGINWDVTRIGILLGGHVRAVFSLITIIFTICVSYTITSFKEMPLRLVELQANHLQLQDLSENTPKENTIFVRKVQHRYGSLDSQENDTESEVTEKSLSKLSSRNSIASNPNASLLVYFKSIIYMPYSIRILCLTNLFCWMAHVCYSLYFTDFVGEAVFHGNPTAPEGDASRDLYEAGVRFGCWGMSMYSLSCAFYSTIIEKLIAKFGAKHIYVGGLLVYSCGMFLMAITQHPFGVIFFSWTAGVMYSTLFTMPYLIVANYHAKGTFEESKSGEAVSTNQIRGLGTDVALVSSMVFLAQFILSMCMGQIVSWSGTTTSVVTVASTLACFGALAATQITYLDL